MKIVEDLFESAECIFKEAWRRRDTEPRLKNFFDEHLAYVDCKDCSGYEVGCKNYGSKEDFWK